MTSAARPKNIAVKAGLGAIAAASIFAPASIALATAAQAADETAATTANVPTPPQM